MDRFSSIHGHSYFIYGSHTILLEWSRENDNIPLRIQTAIDTLDLWENEYILDLIPAYTSLAIIFRPEIITPLRLINHIESILPIHPKHKIAQSTHVIKVDYSSQYALDLAEVAQKIGVSTDEVIEIHVSTEYQVSFIGFLPGFPYLTGLDKRLILPRKSSPRVSVPKGSVAIAYDQCGIYPSESPGGWHILGVTDYKLFDPGTTSPSPLSPGDTIKFQQL